MGLDRIFIVAAIAFSPAILCDWVLSFLGAKAFFSDANSTGLVIIIALVLSLTALVMNFLTNEIFIEAGAHGSFLRALWFVCILYDYYTTLVGIANMVAGAGMFSIATMNIFRLVQYFTLASGVFVLVGSTIFVASPMMTYWLWKKSALERKSAVTSAD